MVSLTWQEWSTDRILAQESEPIVDVSSSDAFLCDEIEDKDMTIVLDFDKKVTDAQRNIDDKMEAVKSLSTKV